MDYRDGPAAIRGTSGRIELAGFRCRPTHCSIMTYEMPALWHRVQVVAVGQAGHHLAPRLSSTSPR